MSKYHFEKFRSKKNKKKPQFDGPRIKGIRKDPEKIDYTRLAQEGIDFEELDNSEERE